MSNSILNRFLEGELNFDPTYKYDDHSNSYDTSQKRRIPAWCDRVLYEKSEKCRGNLELLAYGRKESFFSDHRPVYGIYRAEVCKVDSKQKEEIEKRLLEQLFGSKSNQSSTDFKAEGQNEASDNVAQVNQKFDLMKINIQDGYLDESNANGESTNALDDLLESIPQQTSSSAIDELLNSQHKSQSMHVLGNLISLSPEKNTGQVKSSEALDDLIDLGYVNQPTNQKHHPQYMHQPQFNLHQYQSNQSLPTNYNSQPQSTHNTTFNMQNNYFQFQSTQSSAFNLQQQQQQQPPPTQTDPSKLFDELFQNPIQQPVYQQQPNLGAFNRGLQSLQTQNNNGGKVHNAQNAQEILSQLFGEELLEKQPRQQKEEEEVRSFFQF